VIRRFPLALAALIAMAATPALGEQPEDAGGRDATPGAAEQRWGTIAGTVLWAGKGTRNCEVHGFDMEGHPGVKGGLDNVVVIAEPVSIETQRLFREHPRQTDHGDPETVYWLPDPRVATVAPGERLELHNDSGKPAHIRFFLGRVLLKELSLAPKEITTTTLPEGLVRLVDPHTRISGWVFVTPYPSSVSEGNCRFVFSDVPGGRYRLRGWHPTEGRRSRTVNVKVDAKVVVVTPLIYGAETPTR